MAEVSSCVNISQLKLQYVKFVRLCSFLFLGAVSQQPPALCLLPPCSLFPMAALQPEENARGPTEDGGRVSVEEYGKETQV